MKRNSLLMFVFCLCMSFTMVVGYVPLASAAPVPVNIDFEDQSTGTFTQIDVEGFRLEYIGYGDLQTIVDVSGNNVLKDSDISNPSGAEIRITSIDGGAFYFNSLDYNNFTTDPYHAIAVTAVKAAGGSAYQELYPSSPTYATLTSSGLGVNAIPLSLLRVNIVSCWGGDFSVDNINLTHITVETPISIDIKYGSPDNPVNLTDKGTLPVVIFGGDIDVKDIDPSSILLGTVGLCEKSNGKLMFSIEDVNLDGIMDMVCHFSVPDLVASDDLTQDTTQLELTATSFDESTIFTGSDSVAITPSSLE